MRNIVGVINLHDGPDLGLLTDNRPLGAVTFLGRYGLMDFALSNLSNSGIDCINVLVEKNVRAIREHVRDGSAWINNTRTGYLRLFSNEKGISNPSFNTDIANIVANYGYFDDKVDYVVVANPYHLCAIDFRNAIDEHIANNADITLIYKDISNADSDFLNCYSLSIDKQSNVTKAVRNSGEHKNAHISLATYIISRDVLIKIIRLSKSVSKLYSLSDMIAYCVEEKLLKVQGFCFEGYVAPILSLDNYVRHSLEMLDYEIRKGLFLKEWPIYTVTHNTPPVLYGENADVSNSFVANGSIVKGTVKNSIISRDVIIEKGAIVENSIIFTKTIIGENARLRNVISDKNVSILRKKELTGSSASFLFLEQGANI